MPRSIEGRATKVGQDGPCFLGWGAQESSLLQLSWQTDWTGWLDWVHLLPQRSKSLDSQLEPVTTIHPSILGLLKSYLFIVLQSLVPLAASPTQRATQPDVVFSSLFSDTTTFRSSLFQTSRCLRISGKQASPLTHAASFVHTQWSSNHQHKHCRLRLHLINR